MNPSLAQRLPPALQPLATRMRIEPGSGAPLLSRWLDADLLAEALGRYARNWPQADPRAVASQWHQQSSALILPPLLLARLLYAEPLSLELGQLRMTVDAQGAPGELHVPPSSQARAGEGDGAQLLEALQVQLLEPFISRFARHTGLAPRLLWGNVALCIDWVLEVAQGFLPTRALGEARAHFRDGRQGGGCHALRGALRRDAAGVSRRVCCLRERLAFERCAVCPLAPRKHPHNLPTQP
ncbi:siderophore-iron reductase FhuF [Pseudomonas sp. GD03860]|uniref:siderophore-iron reductase FhuF n=1 Tax=Pseudomonas TaxID=286 RepID=UPI002364721D|nr:MULTISPECIES: siderophore-iron reductase FhuF [Pseudomonas]MDD2058567.1 siderophore-iron reductase FhuF [Pseudomonas putida]MDH0639568.1 siderophore-iron reductase FhuF [Pseudomonas sp. GD03860]